MTWKDAFCFCLAERQVRCEEGGSKEGRHAQPDSAQNRKPVCRRIQVRVWEDIYMYIRIYIYVYTNISMYRYRYRYRCVCIYTYTLSESVSVTECLPGST